MELTIWSAAGLMSLFVFNLVAVPALLLRRNDFADVLWGPAFPLATFGTLLLIRADFHALDFRQILVLALISLWAIRLFAHLGWRNLSHRTEDARYKKWREEWGSNWIWRSYLQVFVLQALILFLFLLPVLYVLQAPSLPLGWIGIFGFVVWLVGFFFESVGDEQLRRFKKDPANKGKLMTRGLWAWTRHPNYFGEVTLWWGIWLLAAELPGAWWTIISPVCVTYLILKVSGVSMLEAMMAKRPGYAEYVQSVPSFFPRPPKRRS